MSELVDDKVFFRRPPRGSGLLIAAFLLLLWMPLIDLALHLDPTPPPVENRILNAFPESAAQSGGVQKYLAQIESWYNDHLGFRNLLVRWHGQLTRSFSKGTIAKQILLGREDWLYLAHTRMVEQATGADLMSEKELLLWQSTLEGRRDWLAARNIAYVYVIPPDKHTVYNEYLPSWVRNPSGKTKLSQLIKHMRKHSTVAVIDLREALISGKQVRPTYLKTDSHWNKYGAFLGTHRVLEELSRQIPGLPVPNPSDFHFEPIAALGGDLVGMLGLDRNTSEPHAFREVLCPGYAPVFREVPGRFAGYGGNTPPLSVVNSSLQGTKALVFHDSFADATTPFFSYSFAEVIYFRQFIWNTAWIEQEKPTAVIDETVERGFSSLSSVDVQSFRPL